MSFRIPNYTVCLHAKEDRDSFNRRIRRDHSKEVHGQGELASRK